jgi:D-erythro-7,8-dihydroneopterin triphosphate epimerase
MAASTWKEESDMDLMHIRDLKVRCIIGTKPSERKKKRAVIINISLECDLSRAGKTDRLEDTINYKSLKDRIVAFVQGSKGLLIERLAGRIAGICLADGKVKSAHVVVDKPGALTMARSAAVEIVRRTKEKNRNRRWREARHR